MKKLLLALLAPTMLAATSPVINRYLPTHTLPEAPLYATDRPSVSVSCTAAHAAKTFARNEDERSLHHFDGLLEISGFYNLQNLVAAKKEQDSSYVAPFSRETGGDAWAVQALPFGAMSSLSAYGISLGMQTPVAKGWSIGVQVPFWHLEARQQYRYPITADSQTISLPDAEQVRRFARYVHTDLQLNAGDWITNSIGDASGWAQYQQTWQYWWLLRSATLAGRLALSVPVGSYRSLDYPHSVPAGNDGHWGAALSFMPETELKECIRFAMPTTLTYKLPHTRNRRLATYSEPTPFSPLIAKTRIHPGLTFRIAPRLTMEHLVENVHVGIGFVWTRHWQDSIRDERLNSAVPSYLSRETLPTISTGMSVVRDEAGAITLAANKADKASRTAWRSSYLSFEVAYEMPEIFKHIKHAPLLRVTFDYCLSGSPTVARTHQITGQLSWRF